MENYNIATKPNEVSVADDKVAPVASTTEHDNSMMKKKTNWLAIVLGVTTMIFAGLAVFFGIQYFQDEKMDDLNSEQVSGSLDDNQTDKKEDDEDDVDERKEVIDMMNEIIAGINGEVSEISEGLGLIYKPDGIDTHINMRLNYWTNVHIENDNLVNVRTVQNKLVGLGFSYLGVIPFSSSAGPEIFGYLNSSNEIVCNVYGDMTFNGNVDNSYLFAKLECGKTDWTWLTEDEKILIKELDEAYRIKTGDYPRAMSNYDNEIRNSEYTPYQTIRVQIDGGYALFYRVGTEAKWQYFTGGQSPLMCSDYDTEDLKKAFAGDTCYIEGDTDRHTVQP